MFCPLRMAFVYETVSLLRYWTTFLPFVYQALYECLKQRCFLLFCVFNNKHFLVKRSCFSTINFDFSYQRPIFHRKKSWQVFFPLKFTILMIVKGNTVLFLFMKTNFNVDHVQWLIDFRFKRKQKEIWTIVIRIIPNYTRK